MTFPLFLLCHQIITCSKFNNWMKITMLSSDTALRLFWMRLVWLKVFTSSYFNINLPDISNPWIVLNVNICHLCDTFHATFNNDSIFYHIRHVFHSNFLGLEWYWGINIPNLQKKLNINNSIQTSLTSRDTCKESQKLSKNMMLNCCPTKWGQKIKLFWRYFM